MEVKYFFFKKKRFSMKKNIDENRNDGIFNINNPTGVIQK